MRLAQHGVILLNKYQRYSQTDKGKLARRRSSAKYDRSEHGKIKKKERYLRWYNSPKGQAANRAKNAKYRAQRRKAIPSWADDNAIRDFYLNCPPGMEVDHIYPIISDEVCGLHTLENLQYLTAFENRSKGNRLP
jgi:hypothetical protein